MKTCIRYLAVVFAVAMLVCALTTVSAGFPDVTAETAHYEAIEKMTNLGIIGGYEDGTFRPDGLVRRDEMAKIVYVMSTTSIDAGEGALDFPDVSAKHWAKGYISWCAAKDIVAGYEDGTFRPAGNITFDEALKMACAMLGYTDFTTEMWPIDVRIKGLNELKLGKGLEDVAGDTALTRAQVVQLMYNAFDKEMKIEGEEAPENSVLGVLGATTTNVKATLKENVWKVDEITAQVVATENYGLKNFEVGIDEAKTDKEDIIKIAIVDEDTKAVEIQTLNLADIALEDYIGNSDDILMFNIEIVKSLETDEFVSASLKGRRKANISGGYADNDGRSDVFRYNISSNYSAPANGVKLDGINHYDEDFWKIRRVTYYEDFVLIADGFMNYHQEGKDTVLPSSNADSNMGSEERDAHFFDHKFAIAYSNSTDYNRWRENVAFAMTQGGYSKYAEGVDIDSDGYYDYLIVEYNEMFRVKSINSKKVVLEYLYNDTRAWTPVPAYTYHDGHYCYGKIRDLSDMTQNKTITCPDALDGTIPALDLEFPIENVSMLSTLEKDDIIVGHQIGDYFTVTAQADVVTGYAKKYDTVDLALTLNSGTLVSYKMGSPDIPWISNQSGSRVTSAIENVVKALTPTVGINGSTGTYNYVKYWVVNGKAVWAEPIDAATAGDAGAGHKKAILLYVTEKTEPQINEATKVNEVFYPAYLLINGRVQLVNLNATYAIDKFSGDVVSQDGSEYRPTIGQDKRVYYVNKLVTYSVDKDGYYTLYTSADTILNDKNEVVERVIKADANNLLSIDTANGIVTITGGAEEEKKIVLGEGTILYYPYEKADTGDHKHIEFYLGSEIPDDFEPTKITSDIFLTKDEETGLWLLGTLVLETELGGTSLAKDDYTKDARHHLYATDFTTTVMQGNDLFTAFFFNRLCTWEELIDDDSVEEADYKDNVVKGGVYAWDAKEKNYVAVTAGDSYKPNEEVTDIIESRSLIFTTSFAQGIKIDETTKIIAEILDKDGNVDTVEEIAFDEFAAQYQAMLDYNENEPATDKLNIALGLYEDEDDNTCVAYILFKLKDYSAE